MKETSCVACLCTISPPYIQCMECSTRPSICLHCFAKGTEFSSHHSNHKYTVIKYDFNLFSSEWKGSDEVALLDALGECGMGNWSDVAHNMQTQSSSQCQKHYNKYYLEDPVPTLPQMSLADQKIFPSPVPFRACEEPPRPAEGTPLQIEMAGYMPARGDFTIEHDNYAEMDLRDVDFNEDSDSLYNELKMSAVQIYGNVLKERFRRKRIVKRCGLINVKRMSMLQRPYDVTIGGDQLDAFRPFNRLMNQLDWDMYMECHHYELKLKTAIIRLKDYRTAGVTSFHASQVYDYLRGRRIKETSKLHCLSEVMPHLDDRLSCGQWLQRQAALCQPGGSETTSVKSVNARRPSLPLDIVGMPGYDKLSPDERQLCSFVRLVPQSFLDFKNILISECTKLGFLRLAHARNLIKIDVNKTRKMYDFLVSKGHINKESSMVK